DTKKTLHLLALDGAKERLHLCKADLLEVGSFESIVDGCDGVFHTASPVLLTPKDPKMELIDPAVKGTINVLSSCAEVPTIKRVVITSSMASVAFNGKTLTPDVTLDESWFSHPVFCQKSELWYPVSKTLTEEAAWRFGREKAIDLFMMHPGLTRRLTFGFAKSRCEDQKPSVPTYKISNDKARSLGIGFTPLE
ncbi:hypothetical protein EUGRSUZ_L03272, partial [Eucalyptus grandis]